MLAQRLGSLCRGVPWRPMLRLALPGPTQPLIGPLAKITASQARIVLLFVEAPMVRAVLDAARTLGLLAGDHLWLFVERDDPNPASLHPCGECCRHIPH